MNNKQLIEKTIITIKENKDSIDRLNDVFGELRKSYYKNEINLTKEEAEIVAKWLHICSDDGILNKIDSILKEAYWRSDSIENKEYEIKNQITLKSLEL